ncbi:F-box/kelch-repeat protein [Sesamum angolense]|uniref:F-box/kelch-repeat protein n=1 Tax=Sesamum angolense TaxID=2727404 RepID=A0AAE2BU95_9LAMI|nr:F-box/kelch-repeat protein [Sesamum angolense]
MNLPEDLTIEILTRLPVRSLIRFKCVCKSWNIHLKNPRFISKHHQTISHKDGSEVLLVSRRDNVTNKRVVSMLRNDGSDNTLVDQDLPTFLNEMFGHVRLIGPCKGVICLFGFPDNIALWNPSIREFKKLPLSLLPRPPNAKILFCVSFDCRLLYQVEIYSSKTNAWKKYDNVVPANIMYYNIWSTVYKNENFCWWAQERDVEVILSFDMSKETFQTTPLPSGIDVLGGQQRITRVILPVKDSIALIVYRLQEVQKVFDIWVLNELGGNGAEGWIKATSIGPLSEVERPLGFWNNDEFILESSSRELVLYNSMNQKIKNLGVYGKRDRLEVLVHKESLFSQCIC